MDLFKDLNEKQREAVTTTEGYVRVIAGAGSGKTKLLVSRYAYLVQEYGIDPANILCVTFTNKAAGEMRKRIRSLIGSEYDTSLICTYHGFCTRILRENPEKLFLTKNFQIIDTYQQKAILEDVYQKFDLKLDYANFEYMLKKIGIFKSDISYVSKMCNPEPCIICNEDKILDEFLQRQKAIYALDFHDLLSFVLYLLRNDKEVRERWQNRLNYIQVDEFQDSSCREMELIDTISGVYKNIMIVGDPDQNIYEWRGSDVKLLVDFDKNHEPTQTIFLNRNYRSTPQILACANSLIDKNELRLKKDLYTRLPDGAAVVHYHSKSDDEETNRIVNEIKHIKQEMGLSYSDFAVLYRSGFLSRMVEKKLVEYNIPYEIYGGVKFYSRMEIQDIVAYLRLIIFDDDLAFKRIVNTPRRKIGKAKIALLEDLRKDGNTLQHTEDNSLFFTLAGHHNDKVFRNSGASGFVAFINKMRKEIRGLRISEIVNRICAESGYEQYIRELGDEERLDNLAEFKRIASEFERNMGEDLSAEEFLQQIALQSSENEEKQGEAVKLMTIHAAKGLEFPVVFVVGFSEKIFPSSKTIEERKKLGLEEERRLCYVAITRAKERLYLMDSEGLTIKGDKKLPSRFLFEIGETNYRRVGEISEELRSESCSFASKTAFIGSKTTEMKVDEMVEHHVFGKGRIIDYNEKRESYTVKFVESNCTRNISKSYFTAKHESLPLIRADCSKNQPETLLTGKINPEINPNEPVIDVDEAEPKIKPDIPAISITEFVPGTKPDIPAASAEKSDNLWKRDDVPHSGWTCGGVTDLGAPTGICQMCGYQIIRYVHHMYHPSYSPLNVGCVCAGKMEGDVEQAKRREQEFKNRQARKENFTKKQWKISKNGNQFIKIKGHLFVIYKTRGVWKYVVDGNFCEQAYYSRQAVIEAVFEKSEDLL